jgi:NADP-dependent 3-hydroxy acid dehydrogenase YdfG
MANPVTLVTGASRGLGAAIALAFAEEGHDLVLLSRNEGAMKELAAGISGSYGREPLVLACDISSGTAVSDAVNKAAERFKRIDVLVNNAGAAVFSSILETTEEDWDAMLDTNLKGTFLVTKAVLPTMIASKQGHIFNILSTAGVETFRFCGAYGASKAGARGFTNVLREETREHGIRVTGVIPGPIDTPIWDDKGDDWDRGKMMRPEDIAQAMISVFKLPMSTVIEELLLRPVTGNL